MVAILSWGKGINDKQAVQIRKIVSMTENLQTAANSQNVAEIFNKNLSTIVSSITFPDDITSLEVIRDHSRNGLSQWKTKLHYKVVSHWLNPYPECLLFDAISQLS